MLFPKLVLWRDKSLVVRKHAKCFYWNKLIIFFSHTSHNFVPFPIQTLYSSFYSGWDDTAIGGINLREESNETLAGYQRNAERLFGEEAQNTTNSSTTTTGVRHTPTATPSDTGSAVSRREQGFTALMGGLVVIALSATFFWGILFECPKTPSFASWEPCIPIGGGWLVLSSTRLFYYREHLAGMSIYTEKASHSRTFCLVIISIPKSFLIISSLCYRFLHAINWSFDTITVERESFLHICCLATIQQQFFRECLRHRRCNLIGIPRFHSLELRIFRERFPKR